jgi:hypothetical protein
MHRDPTHRFAGDLAREPSGGEPADGFSVVSGGVVCQSEAVPKPPHNTQDRQRRVLLGITLAHLGMKADAIREGERGVAL